MDFAASGIIILLLLIPGIVFNKGYFSGEFSRRFVSNDFFSLLITTLLPSLTAYILAFPLIRAFGYYYDVEVLFGLISSNEVLADYAIKQVNAYITEITLFHIGLNILAYLSGVKMRDFILFAAWN